MQQKPNGDREMVDIPALVLHRDEQAVLTAMKAETSPHPAARAFGQDCSNALV
jgi:hypothetical protein